jgi:hypothetical protein
MALSFSTGFITVELLSRCFENVSVNALMITIIMVIIIITVTRWCDNRRGLVW